MPKDLLVEVRRAAKETGLSMADTMRQKYEVGTKSASRAAWQATAHHQCWRKMIQGLAVAGL